jgi:hypothetical protein
MKRKGYLFEQLIDTQNLCEALHNASKGKSHYSEVQKIMQNPLKAVYQLHELLISGNFKNSEYKIFEKFTGRKTRKIYKLPFYPDRVLHHAIVQVLKPIWLNHFIRNTFATIENRGVHDAVRKIKNDLKKKPEQTQYALKLDIRKFYESVDNEILKNQLRQKIKDQRFLKITDQIIDSAKGIPIGNYLSQWLGNYYLSGLDHFIKEKLQAKFYYRYCDDLVILSHNKDYLRICRIAIQNYVESELNLEIKPNYSVFPVKNGIDFLGYRFFHTFTLVRKSIVKDFKKKLNRKIQLLWLVYTRQFI